MKRFSFDRLSRLSLVAGLLALPMLVGCGKSEPAVFRLNLQGAVRTTSASRRRTRTRRKKMPSYRTRLR